MGAVLLFLLFIFAYILYFLSCSPAITNGAGNDGGDIGGSGATFMDASLLSLIVNECDQLLILLIRYHISFEHTKLT